MKKLFLLFFVLSFKANAVEFKIQNICDDSTFLDSDISIFLPEYVSKITHYMFENFEVAFNGDENSISSILGSPTGDQSIEIVSNEHMFIYGWCYEVDGVQPDVLMSQFLVDPRNHKEIRWIFGYAEYFRGEWLSYCTPVYKNPRAFICDNI